MPKEAVRLALKAVELAPQNSLIRDTLGWAYFRNGQNAEAFSTFTECLSDAGYRESGADSSWRGIIEVAQSGVSAAALEALIKKLAAAATGNIAVRVNLSIVEAACYRGQNNPEKAQASWGKTGFIPEYKWSILGPFDNTQGNGLETQYLKDSDFNVKTGATYEGKGGNVGWKQFKDECMDGFVDLAQFFSGRSDYSVAYAYTVLQCPSERQAQLRFGSDDQARVWLNEKQVDSYDKPRSPALDQDVVPITLKSGENRIVVKVCNELVGWGFYFRITDSEGKAFDDLEFR